MMMTTVADTPSIEVRHLRKVYGEIVAVDDLTFTVPRGAVLGLLGGNGAGKTTTIAMLLGPARADGGRHPCAGHRHEAAPLCRPAAHELLVALCRPAASPDGAPEPRCSMGGSTACKNVAKPHRRDRRAHAGGAFPRPPGRQAVGRPEDARGAGQGADQQAGRAAARRAHGLARSRHRRLGAQLPQGLSARDPRHDPARLAQHGRGRAAVRRRDPAAGRPRLRPRQPARADRALRPRGHGGGVPGHGARPRPRARRRCTRRRRRRERLDRSASGPW